MTAVPTHHPPWIGGSGPSDRHNDGFFDTLCDHLVAEGVVVLAYDKRGTGRSTGFWHSATVDDLADDAVAAAALLSTHPRVDPNALGMLGHSEGGWVGLRAASRSAQTKHLIVNSCPGVSFVEAETFALRAAGADADQASEFYQTLTTAALNGATVLEGRRLLATSEHQPWYRSAIGDFQLDARSWAQLRAWAGYDPDADLRTLTKPLLAIFGQSDPLVPVPASVDRLEQTASTNRRRQQIEIFPNADHRLRTPSSQLADGYLTLLADWCNARRSPGTGGMVPRAGADR